MFRKFLTMQLLCKSEYRFYAPFLYTEVISIEKGCFIMKRIICGLLVLCLIGSLAGCASNPMEDLTNAQNNTGSISPSENNSETSSQGTLKLGEAFEDPNALKSGKLTHTITDAKVITCLEDVPSVDCLFERVFHYRTESGEWEVGSLPTFVAEDGTFSDAYLILLDVETTSDGATQYTTKDLDADGYPLGEYDDPYLFRADAFGTLVALNHKENNEWNYYGLAYIEYYSNYNKDLSLPDPHITYRLEPGETIKYTIGFILEDEIFTGFGCEIDFSELYFSTPGQQTWSTLVDLNLEAE